MIIYLIFYQNCKFSCDHVEARSWNDFLLSSVESSRCAGNWQTHFWKLKLKSNKLVDLRNLYLNMIVFRLELLIFWSWFWIWTWKYRFYFLASKSYQNIDLDNRDINLVIIYLSFYPNFNFLTHVDAISWNGDFSLYSVESSRCAANWQTRFWKLK